jgi:hypothetical protein
MNSELLIRAIQFRVGLNGSVSSVYPVTACQVIDLLNPSRKAYLSVRWSRHKGFYVENLFHVECESIDDLMQVLEEGI